MTYLFYVDTMSLIFYTQLLAWISLDIQPCTTSQALMHQAVKHYAINHDVSSIHSSIHSNLLCKRKTNVTTLVSLSNFEYDVKRRLVTFYNNFQSIIIMGIL